MKDNITHNLTAQLERRGAQAVADALHIEPDALRAKLDGRTEWTWGEAVKVAELCGCKLSELAGGAR